MHHSVKQFAAGILKPKNIFSLALFMFLVALISSSSVASASFRQDRTVHVTATKVVCDKESDLPNWGLGADDINSHTASHWVAQHHSCHLVSGWKFQYAGSNASDPGDAFIGEAPGADEDAQGEPFVGAAGQLLNKIIVACGLKREDVYICNILRCRPPGNRNPSPTEAGNCREYLDAQIAIVDPEFILCWGTIAAQNLMGTVEKIGRLRGRFFQHGQAKVLCTYHPSYLLRNPSAKKDVWEDMKLFLKEAGLPVPA